MSYLHLIHAKNIEDIPAVPGKGKILPVLELNTLEWAKEKNPEAYKATIKVKENNESEAKYFKYLRRLLELKFETLKEEKNIDPILKESLNIETLRSLDFLSCSQISMWKSCKRKFFLRYTLGIKKKPTPALHVGSAFDKALNFWAAERIGGHDPPLTAVNAAFYEAFEIGKNEVLWDNEDTQAKLLKQGPTMLRSYIDKFADTMSPSHTQYEIKIDLERGGKIIGAMDFLEEKEEKIIDNKTAKALWETEGRYPKHKNEIQPFAYSLAYFEKYGKMPKEFKYHIVTKEDKPQTQLIAFEVKKYEIEKFKREAQIVWDEIQEALKIGKKAFTAEAEKEDRVSPLCTKEWCEYAENCINDGLKISKNWDKKNKCHVYE